MIFLDSWIWIEFYSESEKWKKCEALILSKERKCISTIILTEAKYKLTKKLGLEIAEKIMHYIEENENIEIIPVTKEIAKLAADLRLKYYKRSDKDLSYADVINLATAILSNCKALYSGDSDFKDVEEIKTVIV